MKRVLKIVVAVAAVMSAAVAWISLYLTYTYNNIPYEPKISFGTPILMQLKMPSSDGSNQEFVAIVLQITAANSGSVSGCISDLSLVIGPSLANSAASMVLYPAYYIDATRHLRGMKDGLSPFESITGPARGIFVAGKQSIERTVLFLPHTPQLRVQDLLPNAAYNMQLFVVNAAASCEIMNNSTWEPVDEATYVLSEDLLTALSAGEAVLPVDEGRDTLRTARPPGNLYR